MGREMEIEVLGLHLTVKRILLLAVLACILVLAGYTASEIFLHHGEGPGYNLTEVDNTTGRYQEDEPNAVLCVVFIFLALVVLYFIVVEIRS